MRDTMDVTGRYQQIGAPIEELIRRAEDLRAVYLRDNNFWPACLLTGGVLLFVVVAVVVPP
jgi:hypothetical protein